MSFTTADAQRAGLNGDNWRKYPAAMLRARCLSAICRAVFPDLCLGLYDPDELAPEPAPAPSTPAAERDVTPSAPKVEAVKAKLAERLAVVDAEVVPAEPKPMSGGDVWKAIQAAAKEAGLADKEAGTWLREHGKTGIKQLAEEDLFAFRGWLAAKNVPMQDLHADAEPPAEEVVPF
jgi:hypothetical protein